MNFKKLAFIISLGALFSLQLNAQFTLDDLKDWNKKKSEKKKKNNGIGSLMDKYNQYKGATTKNEVSRAFFTGGTKIGVAQAVLELQKDPDPAAKRILLVQGGLDGQYTVFQGDKQYAIYRFKNLPPNGNFVQFAVTKEAQKELKQQYKKGTKLEKGYYEIAEKKSFFRMTLTEEPILVLKKVYLKLF
ncbi:MAG: hypothetical protein AAF518_16075 [Spirochaetota bacterium]